MVTRLSRRVLLIAGAIAVAGFTACSPGVPAPPSSSPAITVTAGVSFAGEVPDVVAWEPPVMDVFAPAGAGYAPLVVLFPPHGVPAAEATGIRQLARSLAEAGAVAAVAGWSQDEDPDAEFTDLGTLTPIAQGGHAVAACAVSFAITHAEEWGADPARVVTVGELYGANTAGIVALDEPVQLDGCSGTAAVDVAATVMWDADWLAAMPAFDALGTDAAAAVEVLSPWSLLPSGSATALTAVISADAVPIMQRCGGRDAQWLADRDPDGAIRARLDEVGAFADDCVDPAEAATAAVAVASAAGTTAIVEVLDNDDDGTDVSPAGYALTIGDADLARLVALILGPSA